jgi:hypothetical protein
MASPTKAFLSCNIERGFGPFCSTVGQKFSDETVSFGQSVSISFVEKIPVSSLPRNDESKRPVEWSLKSWAQNFTGAPK